MTFKEKLKELADAAKKETDETRIGDLRNEYGKLLQYINKNNFSQNASYVEPSV